jgi:hypothetical protein
MFTLRVSTFLAFFAFLAPQSTSASILVKQYRRGNEIKVLSVEPSSREIQRAYIPLRSIPSFLQEGPGSSNFLYEEILFQNFTILPEIYQDFQRVQDDQNEEELEGNELRIIVEQGPPKNRINLTILGDGYTLDEKEKFFQDAKRISKDLFEAKAFASYLPLFNIYAVFVPSNESGLTDREPRDTVFGLYRSPPGSKRAILPGRPAAIERALTLAPATDFPIVLANDDFYGGLGGRFAISTRSVLSGSLVLRHELGHNFGNVGEEYDGGSVYTGANFSDSKSVPWQRWIEGDLKIEDTKFLSGEYLWKDLRTGPVRSSFHVPNPSEFGDYKIWIRLSGVGFASAEDVMLSIDGNQIPYEGLFTADRSFFDVRPMLSLRPGAHLLEVKEMNSELQHVLAFAQIGANRSDYDYTPNKIGAFPTFNDSGSFVGYRPTDDSCLMRNMRFSFFCAVDKENMWIRFLNRVELIDSVDVNSEHLVQLRSPRLKNLEIHWYELRSDGEFELSELLNKTQWNAQNMSGTFRARVNFKTPEVRAYSSKLSATKDFRL